MLGHVREMGCVASAIISAAFPMHLGMIKMILRFLSSPDLLNNLVLYGHHEPSPLNSASPLVQVSPVTKYGPTRPTDYVKTRKDLVTYDLTVVSMQMFIIYLMAFVSGPVKKYPEDFQR